MEKHLAQPSPNATPHPQKNERTTRHKVSFAAVNRWVVGTRLPFSQRPLTHQCGGTPESQPRRDQHSGVEAVNKYVNPSRANLTDGTTNLVKRHGWPERSLLSLDISSRRCIRVSCEAGRKTPIQIENTETKLRARKNTGDKNSL